jgi:hypothetical protein
MTRTARCFLALGLSATLAAACDDDAVLVGLGGSSGAGGEGSGGTSAGSGGSGGTSAGSGGSSAGRGGTSATGDGGTGGVSTGSGGTSAGSGGTSAGSGGESSEPSDAGPDAAGPEDASAGSGGSVVDAALPAAPDSGVNGSCPDFEDSALEVEAGGQNIVIARVLFRANERATIVLRAVDDFDFGASSYLCNGVGNCTDVSGFGTLLAGQELLRSLDDLTPDGGEIALLSSEGDFANAYIAWGEDYESGDVTDVADATADPPIVIGATEGTLEEFVAAADPARWTLGDRVDTSTDGINTIVGIAGEGPANTEGGYAVCTGDGDF